MTRDKIYGPYLTSIDPLIPDLDQLDLEKVFLDVEFVDCIPVSANFGRDSPSAFLLDFVADRDQLAPAPFAHKNPLDVDFALVRNKSFASEISTVKIFEFLWTAKFTHLKYKSCPSKTS